MHQDTKSARLIPVFKRTLTYLAIRIAIQVKIPAGETSRPLATLTVRRATLWRHKTVDDLWQEPPRL